MAKIIQFPTREVRFSSELEKQLAEKFSNHSELAECLKKAFSEIHTLCELVSPKSVNFTIPGDITDEQVSIVHDQIKQIVQSHQAAAFFLLKRIAEQKAELCVLAHNQSSES